MNPIRKAVIPSAGFGTRFLPFSLAIAGRCAMTPEIFGFLRNDKPGKDREIRLTDAMCVPCGIQSMFDLEFYDRRREIGRKPDFVTAALEFAPARSGFHDELTDCIKDLKR